jgi:hypothetical protein
MHFAVARHIEVATRLFALWVVVSLAAQSILRHLPSDVSQAGVVGEIVVQFWERADWCSRLEDGGLEVYDLVLGPASDQTCLVACLEEAAGQLRVMQDEQGALGDLTSQDRGPVLRGSDDVPLLVVALSLSSSSRLTETQVNAMAINGVQWGACLALTVVLSHFPELEVELDLLGSGYNADLTSDEMEVLWTQPTGPQNPYRHGFPHQLLTVLLMVPERSSWFRDHRC